MASGDSCAVGGAIGASLSGIGGTSETWVRGAALGGIGGATLGGLARAVKLGGGNVLGLGRSVANGGGAGIPVSASIDARDTGVGGRDGITGRSIGKRPPVPPWSGVASYSGRSCGADENTGRSEACSSGGMPNGGP
jgi:hypothetical protein